VTQIVDAFFHAFTLIAISAGVAAGIFLWRNRKPKR